MASQSDSAGIKFVNVASLFTVLKGSPIYAACMSLETTVNDKKKIYIDKVGALMSVLENVLTGYLSQISPDQTFLLFEFLHRHTLYLILHGDWGRHNAARQHMTFQFRRFETIANRKNLPQVAASIKCLVNLLSDPWGNPTITKIMNGDACSSEEVLRLIKAEMGIVLIVRLEIMAEARCDDQALALIEVCLECVSHPDNSQYFQQFNDEIVYIRDIYLVLLVRAKNNAKIVNEVNKMGLTESLKLVRRSKTERMVRLRKSHKKMADIVANMALTSALIKPFTEEEALHGLIEEWYNLYPDTQVLLRLLRKMIVNAVSSQHIYLLGRVLVQKYGQTEKLFCIELYIRALTVNLNELEKYKSNSEQDKVKESEVQLSNGFLLLADYLKDDILTCRECVLTAFSLNPTISCYNRIRDLAMASGKLSSEQDDNCENNQSSINCEKQSLENHDPGMKIDTGQPNGAEALAHESPALLTQQITQISLETREKQAKSNEIDFPATEAVKSAESNYDILSSPIHISDAQKIGIPQTLCDDLTTVISSARYQVLNWHLDWSELSSRCESYIISGKEHRSTEKELKYLNIDYNQFKDWPRDKMYDTGIEKGFEEFVESDSAEETETDDSPSTESSKRRQSKQSMDEETQDSTDFAGKMQVAPSKNHLNPNPVVQECVPKAIKKQERSKRKALSSISDSEMVIQDRISGNVDESEKVVKETKRITKKIKVLKPEQNSRSLLLKQPSDNFEIIPNPHLYPPYNNTQNLLDIKSIEEDATRVSFTPIISAGEYLSLIKKNKNKNRDITSTTPTDNTETNRNNCSQLMNNLSAKDSKPAQNQNYCIAGNDLTINADLSPLNSPPKSSDPTVLKTLRMYRSKKPSPEIMNGVPERLQERCRNKFAPMLSTVDLHPRILSRVKINPKADVKTIDKYSEKTKPEIINVDDDSEPEIIDLVDDDEEEDNNMNTINSACYSSRFPYDVTSKMKLNFDSVLKTKSVIRKSAFTKPNSINDLARNLGLKSVEMIRPATSETTVQVVQLNSVRSMVTSNSNTNPITTMVQTVAQQTTSSSLGQASSNSLTSNITTVIYTMPHQSTSVSFAQVSNNTLVSNSSLLYTMPQQTSTAAQVRSTTSQLTSDTSKPVALSSTTLPSRILSSTGSQASSTNASSSFTPISTPVRHYYTAPRQVYPQTQGYGSRQSPEHVLLSPSMNPVNQSSSMNIRRNTPSPRETVVANTETANVPINVIRVERISLVPSSESNQPLPNLSPIKNSANTRPQTGGVSRQQLFMRNNVSRATTNTSTQSHPVVTSRGQTNMPSSVTTSTLTSSRSMPVTAHIQRVGYPPETSQSSTGVQLKYIFKEGVLSSANDKRVEEGETDSGSVAMVLSSEQIQQLLPKSTSQEKSSSDQDDSRTQVASLPKFQQAFGRTMYQNSSTPSANASNTESSTLNFVQQIQPSNSGSDGVTSSICTVLSKAVQTTTKDSEVSSKNAVQSNITNEHSNHRKLSLTGNTSTSTTVQTVAVSTATNQIETQLTSSNTSNKTRTNERSSLLQQTPVKILTLAGTNLLQGKSVAILKTSVPPEKLSQTQMKYEGDNRSKETVIRSNMSNMSALLAAALAQQPQLRQVSSGVTNPGVSAQVHLKTTQEVEKKKPDQVISSTAKTLPQKNFRKLPVQNQPSSRYTKPLLQVAGAGGNQNVTSSTPVVTIPIRTVLATSQQATTASRLGTERVEVRSENIVSPSPPEDPSGSSLLDQQLKEFESVFNKVKKTSQMKERTNSTTVQIQPHLNLGQQILLTQPSSSNVEFTNTSTNQTTLYQSTSTSTIHDLQGERVSLTFISQPATGATNTLIPGTSQKITSATPVVVVQSCSKPVTSPALSVTSQSSSSPAPPSTPGSSSGKISTTAIVKQNKPNKSKTTAKTTPTTTLKVSTLPKPQQKPQEDEQTTQRIYAILDKYAEQLRNSPELKNKPAPRRRSNPPTNPNQSSKRKKSTQTKSKLPSQQASCSSSGMEMSPGSEDMRTIGSEDSSNGVSQLSQTLNSPQSKQEDPLSTGDVSSETSESLDSRDTRIQSRVVLAETSTGQSRTVIVQDNVPTQVLNVDASKLLPGKPVVVASQTIVPQLVLPTTVGGVQKMQLFPVPTDGRPFVVTKLPKAYRVHQVTMPRGAPSLLAPGAVVRIPMCGTSAVKQVKLPVSGISTQNISNVITSGTHTFTVSDTGLDINLDSAILLNSTPQQSISFVHRSVPSSSYQSQDSSVGTTTVTASPSNQKTTVAYSTSDIGYIKHEPGNAMPICSPINVIPASTSQDTKPTTSSNVTCITLDDDIEYTADRRSSVTSDVSTLVISQAGGDNKLWRTSDSTKPSSEVKREPGSQNYSAFQPSKSALGHRNSSTSSFLSDQDHFIDSKKMTEKDMNMDSNHDLEIKEEVKPERVMQEPELCDESVSSDSAGSGRVKIKSEEKESSQDIGSPWPYGVTKIECLVKPHPHDIDVVVKQEGSPGPLTLTHSQGNIYKKKSNNVENTIYQMAFKRTERSKISKEHAAALERNIQLQKSLSEECEDLGVEEPSTNDLFPGAELLLDPDHSSHDSQIDLPSETFSQTLNSSSSSDSRAMSPMFPVGKRPVTYKGSQKTQSIPNKTNRFTPIYNPVYQFTEESTSGTVSSTRPDSPDCQIISYKFQYKVQAKLGSNSESSSPLTTRSLGLKGNVSPMVLLQKTSRDQQKSSSSGASTPVNGGESMASPNNDELPNSYTSEETQCTQKTSDDNCKDTEVETTTDSDSNIDALNVSTGQDNSLDNKSSFIPIPNPAASSPFTYAGNRSSLKMSSRKVQMKHEIWKSILRGSEGKEDVDSDLSDPDQVRTSDKRSTSTDDDLQSEGETRAKNGLGESEETQSTSDRNTRSSKKSRKRSGPLVKCSTSKSKVPRRVDTECVEEIISELATPSSICKNASSHHDSSSRRSSLRGHIKKNCPCCNGSTDRPTKTPQKMEKMITVSTPSPSTLVIGLSKKKPTSKSTVKTSHITKKR